MRRLVKGMMIGSIIGGLISLCNRQTRNEVKETWDKAKVFVENPSIIKEKAMEWKETAENVVEDVTEVIGLVENVKMKTQSTIDKIKETKEV